MHAQFGHLAVLNWIGTLSCCLSNPTLDREAAPTTEELQRRTLLSSGINLSKAIMGVGEWQSSRVQRRRLIESHGAPWQATVGSSSHPLAYLQASAHPSVRPVLPYHSTGILSLPRVFSLLGIGTATLWLAFIGGPAAPAVAPPLCVPWFPQLRRSQPNSSSRTRDYHATNLAAPAFLPPPAQRCCPTPPCTC